MIRIYDTKMHKKVDLEPVEHGKVTMYVCGPTVYNYIHIGNARTFISFDVIRRYLSWRGFDVVFVQNVTDVDDKIIAKANEEGRSAAEVAAVTLSTEKSIFPCIPPPCSGRRAISMARRLAIRPRTGRMAPSTHGVEP